MPVHDPRRKHTIKPRVFVPLSEAETLDFKPLECERCGEIRPPCKFQPNPAHPDGVAGYIRRPYCIICPEDEATKVPVAKRTGKKYSYKELSSRIHTLEDKNKELEEFLGKTLNLITTHFEKTSVDTTELTTLSEGLKCRSERSVLETRSRCLDEGSSNDE